jgi:HSP20 family molecular chaperone IbpA
MESIPGFEASSLPVAASERVLDVNGGVKGKRPSKKTNYAPRRRSKRQKQKTIIKLGCNVAAICC